jgi:hypothetical protein
VFGTQVFVNTTPFHLFGHQFIGGECLLIFFTLSFVSTMVVNIQRVWKATHTAEAKISALLQLLPLTLLTLGFLFWVKYSPADIARTNPIALLIAVGLFYPACVERMVVCRLTKDPVPYVYPFTVPVFAGLAQALFVGSAVYDMWIVQFSAFAAIVAYVQFASSVIYQITHYFDITAFHVSIPSLYISLWDENFDVCARLIVQCHSRSKNAKLRLDQLQQQRQRSHPLSNEEWVVQGNRVHRLQQKQRSRLQHHLVDQDLDHRGESDDTNKCYFLLILFIITSTKRLLLEEQQLRIQTVIQNKITISHF